MIVESKHFDLAQDIKEVMIKVNHQKDFRPTLENDKNDGIRREKGYFEEY